MLTGTARFEVGWSEGPTATATVVIPEKVTADFLGILAKSPAVYGEYRPRVEHTDDYPSLSIDIVLPDQTVRFYSTSQGDTHVPWGFDIQGSTFVIDSDEPARALDVISPYLKRDVLRKLMDKQDEGPGMPDTGGTDK